MQSAQNPDAAGEPRRGWRVSTHLFVAWTAVVVVGSLVDLLGPARYDAAGIETNGTWAGRAVLVWIATLILLAAYRGITRRQQPPGPATSELDELRTLGELRETGVLTEDEFQVRKARILASSET